MIPKDVALGKMRALEPYLVPAIVVLVGVGAFGLGRLSAEEPRAALRIIYPEAQLATPVSAAGRVAEIESTSQSAQTGSYVASKNGTKYYLTTCSGAKRIKQENKVYFVSASEAEAAGYGKAANCPGL